MRGVESVNDSTVMNDFSIIILAKNNRNKQSTPLPITQESDETENNGNSTNGKVSFFLLLLLFQYYFRFFFSFFFSRNFFIKV